MKYFMTRLYTLSLLLTLPLTAQAASVEEIESYLNGITTLEADFQQQAPGTPYMTGTLYLNRPKQFLWQYKIPNEQKLVSTGSRLFFHDPETEQTTQLPLHSGFAGLLTKDSFSFNNGDFNIHNIQNYDDVTIIELSLKQDDENSFVLKFNNKPLSLLSMSSRDNFGQGVSILFANLQQGHTLDASLFNFKPVLEEFTLDN
tara:strand:+ start:45003 stop:45605 length:603 start_codon:yes stop_codon:yes gene_type:complete